MKDIINHPAFKTVCFTILFVFASITLFYDYKLITSFISPLYRSIVYFLPTILALLMPIISTIYYFFYIHNFNVKKQRRIMLSYVIVLGLISLLCFIGGITIASLGSFELSSLNSTFPYGTIFLSFLYLMSVAIVFAFLIKNKKDFKVPFTTDKRTKFPRSAISIFMILFGAFFFGDFLSIIDLINKPLDDNFFLMIPIFLTFLYGTTELVLYAIYKNIKNFDDQFRFYKNSLFLFTISYLFLNTFVVAVIMVNQNIFAESMTSFFPTVRFLNFPVGIVVSSGVPLIPIIISSIKFWRAKNEQKQKEIADKI